jgi:hypothetical protein
LSGRGISVHHIGKKRFDVIVIELEMNVIDENSLVGEFFQTSGDDLQSEKKKKKKGFNSKRGFEYSPYSFTSLDNLEGQCEL